MAAFPLWNPEWSAIVRRHGPGCIRPRHLRHTRALARALGEGGQIKNGTLYFQSISTTSRMALRQCVRSCVCLFWGLIELGKK
jgi:hypothetical protein